MSKRNENRPGYKKTRVGWIPEEWEVKKLGTLVNIISGNSPSIYKPSTSGRFPFVKVDDLNNCNIILTGAREYSEIEQTVVPANSVLFAKRGAAIATNKVRLAGRPIVMDSNMMALVPKTIEYLYLFYFIIQQRLWRIADTSTIPQINNKHILPYKIPIPPLPEQKKIAQILSTWDKAIEQTRKLIEAKKQLKKGLMQQLLTGRMRFPQFGINKERIKFHYYNIPKDWDNPRISNIAKEVTNRNNVKNGYPVLSCSKYDGFVDSLTYFGKKVFSDDTSNYKLVKRGQFGFPANHVEEGSIGLLNHVQSGIVSPIYIIFETNQSKVHAPYLYALFKSETYRHIFSVSTNASVDRRGSLRWKDFSRLRVPLPSIAEQRYIAESLTMCNTGVDILNKKMSALEKQKKGLMQKLLTGEIRVQIPN